MGKKNLNAIILAVAAAALFATAAAATEESKQAAGPKVDIMAELKKDPEKVAKLSDEEIKEFAEELKDRDGMITPQQSESSGIGDCWYRCAGNVLADYCMLWHKASNLLYKGCSETVSKTCNVYCGRPSNPGIAGKNN